MKMLVTAIGTIAPPVKIDSKRHRATFTLRVDRDRYFVATIGLDQYLKMKEFDQEAQTQFLILGYAFSYRSNKCGSHHFGIEPIVFVPCEDYNDLINLQDIVSQWFLASLLHMGRDDNLLTTP